MAPKSPLAQVNDGFGDKAKLVEAIEKLGSADLWVARTNENKGLAHVSNAKLLRLHATFTEVKEKFGTREKLIDAVLELEKQSKDSGWRQKLSEWPVPRLFDAYRSAKKRAGQAGQADQVAPPAKTPKAAPKAAAAPDKPRTAKKGAKTATKASPAARKPGKKVAKKTATKATRGRGARG
jgi:hypothetical protein